LENLKKAMDCHHSFQDIMEYSWISNNMMPGFTSDGHFQQGDFRLGLPCFWTRVKKVICGQQVLEISVANTNS
jgi:hypothetical protein